MNAGILLLILCTINTLHTAATDQSSPSKTNLIARATLLKEFPKAEGSGPTTHIYLSDDYSALYQNEAALVFMQQMGTTKTSYKWKEFFKEDSQNKPQELDHATEALEQIVYFPNQVKVFLERFNDSNSSAYLRNGPNFKSTAIQVLPFGPTDHACMSTGWNWLVTLEDGRLINLYYCPYFEDEARYDVMQNMPTAIYELSGTPYKHTDRNFDSVKSAVTLFTKPKTDGKPLVCSFAFSNKSAYSYGTNQDLALIFPHQIMLWKLRADKGTIDAKGTVIPAPKLSRTNGHIQYSFNAGTFAHKNKNLYIVGNNFVWRYKPETEALERFRYTDIPDIDGERLIALAPSDNRLAVADPRAGVSVFDTKTMALLCTVLQGSICKTIAINSCILATSVPCESGPSQDSIWLIEQKTEEISQPSQDDPSYSTYTVL